MKISVIITMAFGLALSWSNANANESPVMDGKIIFKTRCGSCHSVTQSLTGPALAGVDERRSMEWIVSFVRSSQGMIKKGDKEAVALFEKFSKIPMPDHPDLTEENIRSIVEFIKLEAKAAAETAVTAAKPTVKRPGYTPISIEDDGWLLAIILFAILLLIAALLLAVKTEDLKRELRKKQNVNNASLTTEAV